MRRETGSAVARRNASPDSPVGHPGVDRRGHRGRARDAVGRLAQSYGAHRYAVLFYTLLLALAAAPLLKALHFEADLVQFLLAFSLLVALLDIPEPGWRLLLMLLMAVAVALRVVPRSRAARRSPPAPSR